MDAAYHFPEFDNMRRDIRNSLAFKIRDQPLAADGEFAIVRLFPPSTRESLMVGLDEDRRAGS